MSAKKAAKKTAKKAVKKAPVKKKKSGKKGANPSVLEVAEKKGSGFNILTRGKKFAEDMRESLHKTLAGRKGRQILFQPQSQLEVDFLPFRSFLMKEAAENVGIRQGTVFEVIGQDGLGKSSLIYNLLGGFMLLRGSPCCVVVGENKPLETLWAKRCMTSDPVLAAQMADAIHVVRTTNLDEMAENVEEWVKACRDPSKPTYVPLSVPLVIVVDPAGKIATKEEAAGIVAYAGFNDPKVIKPKEITGGSNFSRAKWMAEWLRKINAMSVRWNITLIVGSHQNDKMDLKKGKKASFLPQWQEDAKNRTKNGGNASNQSCSLQFVLVDRGYYYVDKKPIARKVTVSVYKNSYGADKKTFNFALKGTGYDDRPGYLDQGFRMDYPMVEWLADKGYLDVRKVGDSATTEKFSSKLLGFTSVSIIEAAEVVGRPESIGMIHDLGTKLMVPGYVNLHEEILKKIAVQQSEVGPAVEVDLDIAEIDFKPDKNAVLDTPEEGVEGGGEHDESEDLKFDDNQSDE